MESGRSMSFYIYSTTQKRTSGGIKFKRTHIEKKKWHLYNKREEGNGANYSLCRSATCVAKKSKLWMRITEHCYHKHCTSHTHTHTTEVVLSSLLGDVVSLTRWKYKPPKNMNRRPRGLVYMEAPTSTSQWSQQSMHSAAIYSDISFFSSKERERERERDRERERTTANWWWWTCTESHPYTLFVERAWQTTIVCTECVCTIIP